MVNLLRSTLESEDVPAEVAPLAEPRRLFVPDALTNPEYLRYALKGSLAVMICYLLQSAVDWPGIRTCIVTCMIVGLTSEGATIQKATLRLSGALVGALMGFLSILLLIPGMVSITSLVLVVAAGTAVAGWVNLGSARISYAGVQIAFAFFVCVIQGFAPNWHFDTIRDRLVGILLGNVVITLVFLYVWPVDALMALRRNLAAALRTTARLATVEGETDDPAAMARSTAALRAQSDRSFGAVQQSLEEAGFEPGVPGEGEWETRAALQRVTIDAQAVFLNQLAVARHRPDFALDVLPPPVRAGIRRLNTAVAARLDAVADRIEGKAETPLPDLQAPLADLAGVVESFLGHVQTPDVAAQARGRLDLYRVLVPRIEALSAASFRGAPAPWSRTMIRARRWVAAAAAHRAVRGLRCVEPDAQHPAVTQPTVGVTGPSSRFGRPRAARARERTEHGSQRRSREDLRAPRAHRHCPANESGDARGVGTGAAGGDRRGARRGHVLSPARRDRDGGRRPSGTAIPAEPVPGGPPQRLPDREHPARAPHRVARVVAARLRPPRLPPSTPRRP